MCIVCHNQLDMFTGLPAGRDLPGCPTPKKRTSGLVVAGRYRGRKEPIMYPPKKQPPEIDPR